MTKTLKTLFFFICYHPSPRQPVENVRSFGPEGWGYSEGGQIKTNFSLFSFVCVCVSVKYFWPREALSPVVFFWKSVGIPVFLLMQCKSGSLYFPHKLLNETVYLRSMKSVFSRLSSTVFSFIYQDNLLKRTMALWSPKRRENCACICLIPQPITSK